jgi:type I restriction enzyme M protein
MSEKNKFCRKTDLHNEADVEQNFARRFIESLGYRDDQIRPKDSLDALAVSLGRGRTAKHRPDFAVRVGQNFRWIFEAKAPGESLEKYIGQAKGYCDSLNGQYKEKNPVTYYVLSNAFFTRLYKWDVNEPLVELRFEDFADGNKKFKKLCEYLSPSAFTGKEINSSKSDIIKLEKLSLEEVNAAFSWCHQHIYKKDAMSQAAAFQEFVKVVFLKLLSDREIRDQYPELMGQKEIEVPADDVWFSLAWIEKQHAKVSNPLNAIQFRNMTENLETDIKAGRKKRIFNSNEQINLSPETIKGVVGKLENIFLFGIDADLNGRLFETFLNATMRGKDLGQFFTPRSIVKLGTRLARLQVDVRSKGTSHTDKVIDACCGSGGFLIEALADMWDNVDKNDSLTEKQRQDLRILIAETRIFGVDLGKEPPLARIARMNMYLHGDGGSSIYQTDMLDKEVKNFDRNPELSSERDEFRSMLSRGGVFDVVLTNPPFAKAYERSTKNEARILDGYEIAFNTKGGKRQPKASLKSSLMFMERYHDVLVDGGRMVTVIDDGILSGDDYASFRAFVRRKFIVRGVVSLPGDAFQRSKARVKTSLLILEKKSKDEDEETPQTSAIFMYPCQYVGLDDPSRQRILPVDRENRISALKEIETVGKEYDLFLQGKGSSKYLVQSNRIVDRMDVKSSLGKTGRSVSAWKKKFTVTTLGDLADLVEYSDDSDDTVLTKDCPDFVTHLRVRYDGYAESGEEIVASDSAYDRLYKVHENDIAISGMAAFYGSSAVVAKEFDGYVVTSEYLLLRAKPGIDPRLVWMLLRSPEVRADMLLLGTGIARTRIKWENVKEINVPMPDKAVVQEIMKTIGEAEVAEKKALEKRHEAKERLEALLELDNAPARVILNAFKPPK